MYKTWRFQATPTQNTFFLFSIYRRRWAEGLPILIVALSRSWHRYWFWRYWPISQERSTFHKFRKTRYNRAESSLSNCQIYTNRYELLSDLWTLTYVWNLLHSRCPLLTKSTFCPNLAYRFGWGPSKPSNNLVSPRNEEFIRGSRKEGWVRWLRVR